MKLSRITTGCVVASVIKCYAMPSAKYRLSTNLNLEPCHFTNLAAIPPSLIRAAFEYIDEVLTFPDTEKAPKGYRWQSYQEILLHIWL